MNQTEPVGIQLEQILEENDYQVNISANLTDQAMENGVPLALADEFTPCGLLALQLGEPILKAKEFKECSQTNLETLKALKELDIPLKIAFNLTGAENYLEELKDLTSDNIAVDALRNGVSIDEAFKETVSESWTFKSLTIKLLPALVTHLTSSFLSSLLNNHINDNDRPATLGGATHDWRGGGGGPPATFTPDETMTTSAMSSSCNVATLGLARTLSPRLESQLETELVEPATTALTPLTEAEKRALSDAESTALAEEDNVEPGGTDHSTVQEANDEDEDYVQDFEETENRRGSAAVGPSVNEDHFNSQKKGCDNLKS